MRHSLKTVHGYAVKAADGNIGAVHDFPFDDEFWLAGDTLRSAADLELPVFGVSLLYRKGYFAQSLDEGGWQTESPVAWPVEEACREEPARAAGRAWRFNVTGATGHDVLRFHLNEGHAALLALELLDEHACWFGRKRFDDDDVRAIRQRCVFTTHTPVPAGHDTFTLGFARGATTCKRAALNGVPNLSVLDGWWVEGCLENVTGSAFLLETDRARGREPLAELIRQRHGLKPVLPVQGDVIKR